MPSTIVLVQSGPPEGDVVLAKFETVEAAETMRNDCDKICKDGYEYYVVVYPTSH